MGIIPGALKLTTTVRVHVHARLSLCVGTDVCIGVREFARDGGTQDDVGPLRMYYLSDGRRCGSVMCFLNKKD